ncbi:MAG: PKD domain-containing protein [Sphingobacteriales bacterium]|nr:MAG: PKD domain-containing protein [Sphingobacteriales bacterium]
MIRWAIMILFLLTSAQSAWASHIVGGEFQYVSLNQQVGSNLVRYKVTFRLYMDCGPDGAEPNVIRDEDTLDFGLYRGNKQRIELFSVFRTSTELLPANFQNSCVTNPPTTCLIRNTYEFELTLPNDPTGHIVVQNNCCRNGSVINIANPASTGSSYSILLPPRSITNSSAVFQNIPPQIICINVPFEYDHSATDIDGDSLSYGFGMAYNANINVVGGNVFVSSTPPPFPPVSYIAGFTATKPMAGAPLISINPKTGVIKGTPNLTGRFVVAVYCYEWRNGMAIDTVVREYQFVVTNCSKAVIANIPQYSEEFNTYIVQCKSLDVQFDNLSTGGTTYFWDFGVPGVSGDTSTLFNPEFTYPDTGAYRVSLIVNKNSTCSDSMSRLVKVYPTFKTEFETTGNPCPEAPIIFNDLSASSNSNFSTNFWLWNFGDGNISTEQNPTHVYPKGGTYQVAFIASNTKGCSDTLSKEIQVEAFRAFAGNDTIIVKGESIHFDAKGGGTYSWTPDNYLNSNSIGNPTGYFPDTGRFTYVVDIVSPFQCSGSDSITVWVVAQDALFVPSGFSPNGDGVNDVLRPIGIGYRNIRYFRIFNRWGEQVFYTTQFNEGWDGSWKGRQADIGTYYWVLSLVDRFGKEKLVKGDAALLR